MRREEQKQKKPASLAISPNVFRFSPTFLTSRSIFLTIRHLPTQVGTTANSAFSLCGQFASLKILS